MDKKEKKPKIPSDWKRARGEIIDHFVRKCRKSIKKGGYLVTIIQEDPNTAIRAATSRDTYTGFSKCLASDEFDPLYGILLAFQRAGADYWRGLAGDRESWYREVALIGIDEWLNRAKGAS